MRHMSEEHLRALAEQKDSLVKDALVEYFRLRELELLQEVKLVNFSQDTLLWLKDIQSRLTEGVHLLAIFDRASELLTKREK